MATPRRTWMLGTLRLVGGAISACAALVSILSYTSASHAGTESHTQPHGLALAPSPDTAESIGDTIQLAALITDERGAAVPGARPVWTSTDPGVLTVDQAGTVVVAGAGSGAAVVRVGELEARRRIVVRQRPARLELSDSTIQVNEGERVRPAARVLDARGHPISTFEPSWSSGDAAVAMVDSEGFVSAVSPGETQLTATAPGGLQGVVRLTVLPVPSSTTVLGGEGQRAPAGARLATPVTAQVVSRSGRPVAGVAVRFEAAAGGSAEPEVDTSDAQGMVRAGWILGELPGRQRISVVVDGIAGAPVLTAEADPVPANTRISLAESDLSGVVGDSLAAPLLARVTDSLGRALADIPVAWIAADGGNMTGLTSRTDSLGEARAVWRLGRKAGRQRARLQAGNPRTLPPFTMSALARAGTAVAVAVFGGSGQSGVVGRVLAAPIVVRALDRYGNPVAGASLIRATGAGAALDGVSTTDSSGKARFRWTLGSEAGTQRLLIRLRDDTVSAVAVAKAGAGEPAALTLVGPGRWNGGAMAVTLALADGYGNPVAGRLVTLSTPSGTVKPAKVNTDAEGRAQALWTPRAKVRGALTAAVPGTKISATLSRTPP
jgi:Bacterial Ig-like domain (group 1)